MRVISLRPLREFWAKHPDAGAPLRAWYSTALGAEWKNLQDVRATYPHADAVKAKDGSVLTVFNVSGNKYRLITRIRYDYQLVNVREVLKHADYDRGKWKE